MPIQACKFKSCPGHQKRERADDNQKASHNQIPRDWNPTSPGGGIGRRARFRCVFRKECRFKSCSGHQRDFASNSKRVKKQNLFSFISQFWPPFGHLFVEVNNLAFLEGTEYHFLTILVAELGTCAEMGQENITYRLCSGKEKYIAEGGKVGRKKGYQKPNEKLQEEYAGVIKQLRKGYPIRMIAKNEGVGISTVQRMKKKFVDVA